MMPAPTRAARRAAVGARGGAQDRNRVVAATGDCRIARQRVAGLAAQQLGHTFEGTGEARGEVAHVEVHHREVLLERTGGQADADPLGMACRQPRGLLRDQCRGPQRRDHRACGGPTARHGVEQEARELERIREVSREAAVMLAGHHAVETVLGRERGLGAHLGHDLGCAEVEVRVAAQRDRPVPEGPTGVHGRRS